MATTEHPFSATGAARAPAAAVRPLRVLVVEDHADTRYLVCEMLKVFGHRVRAAADGERALRLLAAHRFDILMTDVCLPGLSGLDLARRARAGQPDLNVVFCSGFGPALTAQIDFPARTLQKPYDIEQLREAILQAATRAPPTV
jgi:CheY-like chemotaxis protein